MEDAALLRPESGSPLVFTVDFITPIVDDAATFGAISAANALSDVYAMGGVPQAAMAICGFPEDKLDHDVLAEIFAGGRDKAAEAGCAIVGGHTVIDPELKYGLCVIGTVRPGCELLQSGARAGDRLILTKPLGTGLAGQAIKKGVLGKTDERDVISCMTTLNRDASEAAIAHAARAATDVTGFGLLGHLHHVLAASGVRARIDRSHVPEFPFAAELLAQGLVPGGTRRNLEYVEPHVHFGASLSEADRLLLCDAQTSGGLLIAIPEAHADALRRDLEARGVTAATEIGVVLDGEPGSIEVRA